MASTNCEVSEVHLRSVVGDQWKRRRQMGTSLDIFVRCFLSDVDAESVALLSHNVDG